MEVGLGRPGEGKSRTKVELERQVRGEPHQSNWGEV